MSAPSPPNTAERRWATLVFADLSGSTRFVEEEGDEVAYPIFTECVRHVADVAVRHGAASLRDLGDGVMALFGAPRALEAAPRAAVNVAIEMRQVAREFFASHSLSERLALHFGANTGWVMAGELDAPHLRQTPVVGDTANVAARLCGEAARDEVIVGLETWLATRDEFDYRELPPATLKGKRLPVRCFQLLSNRQQLYRSRPQARVLRARLVGRDGELARLRRRLTELAQGNGGAVGIVAEAGLGKSRLLAELASSEEAAPIGWLEARALSTGQHMPYHPFVDLLRGWAGVEGAAPSDARDRLVEALGRWLGEEARDVVAYLAALTQVPLEAEEQTLLASMAGEARELNTRRAVEQTLATIARKQPLAIVFDDCHWADESSLELLESLLRSEHFARTLFVLAFRPGYPEKTDRIEAALRATRSAERVEQIRLTPLDRADRSRLVDGLLRGASIPDPVRREIVERTAGNPYFTEEVIRSLVDEDALRIENGELVATDRIARAVIPGTIKDVLLARIDRLGAASRRVLEVAAVLGPSFDLPILAEVSGKDGLDDALDQLTEAGLLAPALRRGGDASYAFHHPLVQQVAYEKQLSNTRRELHGKAAAAIESILTDKAPGYNAMLAYHHALAEDSERAEHFLFRAGQDAARIGASSEALHFFQQAADRYMRTHGEGGDSGKKAELEKAVATAWFNRGGLSEAVVHFTKALSHLGDRVAAPGLRTQMDFVRDLAAAAVGLYLGTWGRGGRAPATAVQREIVDIRFRRGLSQSATSSEFVFDTMGTLRRVARLDPRSVPEAGAIYAGASAIFSYGGVSFSLGRRVLDVSRRAVAAGDLRELELYHRLMVFIHHYLEGDWSEAHAIPEAIIEAGERYGRLWEIQTYWDLDADRRTHLGDWDGALQRLEQLDAFSRRYDHDVARGAFHYGTTRLHLERRDARAALESAAQYRTELSEPTFQVVALSAIAKAHVLLGELDAAEVVLDECDAVEARAGLLPPFHRCHLLAARTGHTAASLEAAKRSATHPPTASRGSLRTRLVTAWLASRVAAFRPEIERNLGTIAWLSGRRRRAARFWRQSLDTAQRLGAGPERARTHWEIARLGAADARVPDIAGLGVAAHREAALRLFEEFELERERFQVGVERPALSTTPIT